MTQSRLGSFLESNANTAIGFVGSMLLWEFVVKPVWGFKTGFADNFTITCVYTVWSIFRGYWVRRYFNWRLHRGAERLPQVHRGYADTVPERTGREGS